MSPNVVFSKTWVILSLSLFWDVCSVAPVVAEASSVLTFLGEEQAAKTVILNTITYANVFFIYIFR